MPVYVCLWKFDDQNIKDVKKATEKAAKEKIVESMGGKFITGYWLTGAYDGIIIAEFPDDESCAAGALKACSLGFRTTTMRAFDSEQFGRILDRLS